MKTVISEEDFQKVLELLGLPGDTLRFEVGPRDEPMVGVNSSWRLKATIAVPIKYEGHENVEPYQVRVVYVPVMIPGDAERNETRRLEIEQWRSNPEKLNHWCAPLGEENSPLRGGEISG